MRGNEFIADVVMVDQSPIGKTPRSNPVTYMKAFDDIRVMFSQTREAIAQNFGPGHFSFNVPGGRCERCQGSGIETVSMQFLADVDLLCEECGGRRYKPSILEIQFKGRNIHQILQLTITEALAVFAGVPRVTRKLKILEEVGLGYLRLGQSATTLSGGEAQRIKLCSFLAEQQAPNTLYILDEPTTGLHVDDVGKLLRALDRLLNAGSTLLIVEHNLDIIKNADWIIDLGPEGGEAGGYIVAEGTPEEICRSAFSHTGKFLQAHLAATARATTKDTKNTKELKG
jgi:excinuclease ABC subunit A